MIVGGGSDDVESTFFLCTYAPRSEQLAAPSVYWSPEALTWHCNNLLSTLSSTSWFYWLYKCLSGAYTAVSRSSGQVLTLFFATHTHTMYKCALTKMLKGRCKPVYAHADKQHSTHTHTCKHTHIHTNILLNKATTGVDSGSIFMVTECKLLSNHLCVIQYVVQLCSTIWFHLTGINCPLFIYWVAVFSVV